MSMYNQADESVTGETLLSRAEEYMRSFYKEHGRTEELDDRWARNQLYPLSAKAAILGHFQVGRGKEEH